MFVKLSSFGAKHACLVNFQVSVLNITVKVFLLIFLHCTVKTRPVTVDRVCYVSRRFSDYKGIFYSSFLHYARSWFASNEKKARWNMQFFSLSGTYKKMSLTTTFSAGVEAKKTHIMSFLWFFIFYFFSLIIIFFRFIPWTDSPYNTEPILEQLEKQGQQGNKVLLEGIKTGSAKVSVR